MNAENIMNIPLDLLTRSERNVRTIDTEEGLAELAASILNDGLIHNLTVEANPPGSPYTHGVVAGGRRLMAMKLAARQRKIPANYPVRCRLVSAEEAAAISLIENQMRAPMHPLDQLGAFVQYVEAGNSVTDTAARFGVTEAFVKQRLKLAAVSPKLLDAYRSGAMTLEQLQAFTVTDDHAAQEEVWDEIGDDEFNNDADDIRRELLGNAVSADDYRLKYVGLAAYQKAGGAIIKADLFAGDDDDSETVSDPDLLDRMAFAKLGKRAAKLQKDESLAFVEVLSGRQFSTWQDTDFVEAHAVRTQPSAEVAKQLAGLHRDIADLTKKQADADEADDQDEWSRLEGEIDAKNEAVDQIEESLKQPHPDEAEHIGAFLCLGSNGKVTIERNIIRREHRAKTKPAAGTNASTTDGDGEQPEAPRLSEKLVRRLTAHKTVILRDVLMPHVTSGAIELAIVVHHMLIEDLNHDEFDFARGALTMTTRALNSMEGAADDIESSPACVRTARRTTELLAPIRAVLAGHDNDAAKARALLDHLVPMPVDDLLKLLSMCVANRVDVVSINNAGHGHSQVLAERFLTDTVIRSFWQPTRERYLDHVSKPQIIADVTEACGAEAAAKLAALKKADAADLAETMLCNTTWLPAPLRVDGEP